MTPAARARLEEEAAKAMGRFMVGLRTGMRGSGWTGVNPLTGSILRILAEGGADGATPGHIAKTLGLTAATVTGGVNKLEEDGYLVRDRSASDRRLVHLRLTPKGRKLHAGFRAAWMESFKRLFEGLSDAQVRDLRDILDAMVPPKENP
jgi:DNA-binding MarR family transcriptional regulator